ncbi:hypothetical protein [Cardinium endosymbiont of Nabis limbatus]|uniref:hypothetical protein n=1 Tax=Cardinium endosymbiont of Nabis limbatus TaxID=3066217 RepID=UPI003AF3CDA7
MKTTKNKIIKGIKVLSNGPLYCATFISVGCDLFGGKKDMTPITDTPSKPSAPYSAYCKIDENEPLNEGGVDNPGFKGSSGSSDNSTDENKNLVGSPNVEKECTEQKQNKKMPSSAPATKGSNTTNSQPALGKNNDIKPNTNTKDQNRSATSTDHSNNTIVVKEKGNDQSLENSKNQDITTNNEKEKSNQYRVKDLEDKIAELITIINNIKDKNKASISKTIKDTKKFTEQKFIKNIKKLPKEAQQAIIKESLSAIDSQIAVFKASFIQEQ